MGADLDLTTQDYLREIAARRDAAPHGGRSAVIDEAAAALGRSRQWVLGALKALGLAKARAPRSDRGSTSVPEEVLKQVAALTLVGARAHGKQITTLKYATRLLAATGAARVDPDTGEVLGSLRPATVGRALQRQTLHPEQLRRAHPVTPQRSKHPNWAWQIDVSRCVLFYLPGGEGVRIMEEDQFYKNKLENLVKVEKHLVNRWLVVDKMTGCFHLRYLPGGESAENAIEFLVETMTRRDSDVLCGVPFVLGMDAGLAAKRLFADWVGRLGIQLIQHHKNPRANGSAEAHQQVVEVGFESRLRLLPGMDSFAALNREADQWRRSFLAHERHSRTGLSRAEAWLRIRPEELRLAAADLLRALVASGEQSAQVNSAYRISFSPCRGRPARLYDLRGLDGVYEGARVSVRWTPYRWPALEVGVAQIDGTLAWHLRDALEVDWAGQVQTDPVYGESYADHPKTLAERNREQIEAYAYGVETPAEVAEAKKARVVPIAAAGIDAMADIRAAPPPAYLPRAGTDLPAAVVPSIRIDPWDAMERLANELGDAWDQDAYAWFTQRYPEGISEDELPQVAARLRASPARHRPVALTLVGAS